MALLSASQITGIKDVLQTVTDTFCTTPVTYNVLGDSVDRYNEDRLDNKITAYNVKGLVEYGANDSTPEISGAMDYTMVKVTFNYRDITKAGLSDGNNGVKMNPTKDYMIINTKNFRVEQVYIDGAIEPENVLVMVIGKLDENKS